jgi:hypothetical protein
MQAIREITNWTEIDFQPNHTYLLNAAGKAVAYIKAGTTEPFFFTKPMSFTKSYRKFEKVSTDLFGI